MLKRKVDVLDLTHVGGRDDDTNVTEALQHPTVETGQANGHGATCSGELHRFEHIRRSTTPADADDYIVLLHEVLELFDENPFICGVVRPGGKHRHIVSEPNSLEAATTG